MNIEETVISNSLPCNSIAMISRLRELLDETNTNCIEGMRTDPRVRAVLWLLNYQFYGQLANIDMCAEWSKINKDLPEFSA